VKAIILLNLLTFLSSCTTSYNVRTKTAKIKYISSSSIYHRPIIADLDIKETKVTGIAISHGGQSVETVSSSAVANALRDAKADVLIDPIFDYEITNKKTTVTVSGYPGTYKNFRALEQKDVPLINLLDGESNSNIVQPPKTPTVENNKPKQTFSRILNTVLIVGSLASLVSLLLL